ncbi:MAG: YdcF family protein [Lachnospiraceae bacterium]|nr:YdcF family protein [Lachnospiraceae bacterium]
MTNAFLTGLGLLSITYGISIGAARSGSKFYLVWIAAGAILLLISRPAFLEWWNRLPHIVHYITGVFVAAVLVFFLVCEGMIISRFSSEGQPGLDYLIVLGAQVREDGPSRVLRYRLDAAAAYLEENAAARCIVSGGKGGNEVTSEAEGMKNYLVEKGIAEERILMEDRSRNTIENIRFSMKLFDPEKDTVGIVTNNFHIYRSVSIAKKQGLGKVSGIAAKSTPYYLPTNLLREFFGVVKDKIKGNM